MKEIQLTQGYTTHVSDKDYSRCMVGPKWTAHAERRRDGTIWNVYATRNLCKKDGARTTQYMQCFLLGTNGVDHEDGNGLNNQGYNLRPATKEQNNRSRGLSINSTSGCKGVSWSKAHRKWKTQIKVNGKSIHLGLFVNTFDAARAYDTAAIKYFGEFAKTNATLGLLLPPLDSPFATAA